MRLENMGTHEAIKNLIKDGFSEHDAESIIRNVQLATSSEVVTKSDLLRVEYELRTEITELRVELNNVKENMVTKVDFSDLRASIERSKAETIKWMIPFFLTNIGLVITVLFFVVKPYTN